jgi:hypothetical protein
MSSTGSTAQDPSWKAKEKGDETRWARERESAQLQAIRDRMMKEADAVGSTKTDSTSSSTADEGKSTHPMDRDFEGGFGGQEDLEDRYATTSGEH